MRPRLTALLVVLLLLIPSYSYVAAGYSDEPVQYYELVVELEPGVDPLTTSRYIATALDIPTEEQGDRVHHIYRYALNGFSIYLTGPEIARFERISSRAEFGIHAVEESQSVSLPLVAGSLALGSGADLTDVQLEPSGIRRIDAAPVDASAVDVAVIDTGVDADHPDLNVVGGYSCVGEDTDDWADGHGHGTHVAGTIAARDNNMGVVGVAPGARIWAIRVLDSNGSGSTAGVICGIDWLVGHADVIDVANMSLGGTGYETACFEADSFHNALCAAADVTTVVVAAGNSAQEVSSFSPANFPEVVTVSAYADFDGLPGGYGLTPGAGCAAMSVDDELATFSNYGAGVDISAPGTCILSTFPGGEYAYMSGTSMASPHMAGAVARYLAANPDQTGREAVTQILAWSAAHTEGLSGDHDSFTEPVLYIGSGAPRAGT